jgi:hypothetical protein
LFSSENARQKLTMKKLINQVLYRVDDSTAQFFVTKYLERYQNVDDKDFERRISLKKDAMIEALTLLKVTKIGIDEYKQN